MEKVMNNIDSMLKKYFDTDTKGFIKAQNKYAFVPKYTTLGHALNVSLKKVTNNIRHNVTKLYSIPIKLKTEQYKSKLNQKAYSELKSTPSIANHFKDNVNLSQTNIKKLKQSKVVNNYKKNVKSEQKKLKTLSKYKKLPQDSLVKLSSKKNDWGNLEINGFRLANKKDIYSQASGIKVADLNKPNYVSYSDYSKQLNQFTHYLNHNGNSSDVYEELKRINKQHPELKGDKYTIPKLDSVADLSKYMKNSFNEAKRLPKKRQMRAVDELSKVLQTAKQTNTRYLSPKTDAMKIGDSLYHNNYIPKHTLLTPSDTKKMIKTEQERMCTERFHLYRNNPKFNPMINYNQAKSIYDRYDKARYNHQFDDMMGNVYTKPELQQINRTHKIVFSLRNSGAVIHYRDLVPFKHRLYKKDVKEALGEIKHQTTNKIPNIDKQMSNPKNPLLNHNQIKNFYLHRAKLYGNYAYSQVMNDKLTTPNQRQTMKEYKAIKDVNPKSYLESDKANSASCLADNATNSLDSKTNNPFDLGAIYRLPHNVSSVIHSQNMSMQFARAAVYDKNLKVHLNDVNKPLDKMNDKLYDHLQHDWMLSTNPAHNIEFTPKQRKYSRHIIKLTQKMEDNDGRNNEQFDAESRGIITKADTKNWSKKDKNLFNKNQKIWKQLYRDGVAPIPEYTPGRQKFMNGSRIGKMSYIVKHVSEGDFTKEDVEQGMKIAQKRQRKAKPKEVFNKKLVNKKGQRKPVKRLHHQNRDKGHGSKQLNLFHRPER